MTTLPYQGNPKSPDWYAAEQERYLREKLGDELNEWLNEQVKKESSRRDGAKASPLQGASHRLLPACLTLALGDNVRQFQRNI